MADLPAVDILVCTLDRGEAAASVVRDVLPQLAPHDTVLVLDQSADPAPLQAALAALADPRVHHRAALAEGLPAARNRALALTASPLVIFFDDDVEVAPGCIAAHRQALSAPEIGGSVGWIEERGMRWNAPPSTNRVGWDGRVRVHLQGERAVDVRSVKGCNMGLRRAAVERVGGFDPGYRGTSFLEETDLSTRIRRAGWRIRYEPRAAVVHHSAPTGGVRQGGRLAAERWRFINTGRYLARHRGVVGLALAAPSFAAIAARRALELRSPSAALTLPLAMASGAARVWREGRG